MNEDELSDSYQRAAKRLLLLDYDGTLVEFNADPQKAVPDEQLLSALKRLADDNRNTVVIISGRDKEFLDRHLGDLDLNMVAEHGLFTKRAGKPWQIAEGFDDRWKPDIRRVMEDSVSKVKGTFIEEKTGSLVWHYRPADASEAEAELPRFLEKLREPAKKHGLKLMQGHKNVEAKLSLTDKGTSVKPWLKPDYDFILAAGDDVTDEDLFRAMPPSAHTLKIGPGQTTARHRLTSVRELRPLLNTL